MGPLEQVLKFAPYRQSAPVGEAWELDDAGSALLGNSMASAQLRAQVRRVAPYFRSLSLTGEPGCGEEAVARLLHQMCPLHELEFVVLHPAEAEERFAVDAAAAWRRVGLLYLQEAERLSRVAQEGLLRMMRQQGAQSTRVVAFVGRGLKPYISAGFFLPELAGCLTSLRMALPGLRERVTDIPMLIQSRLQQRRMEQAKVGLRMRPLHVPEAFLQMAAQYAWPGNLFQLNDVMDWLLEHRAGTTLDEGDLMAALEACATPKAEQPAQARLVKLDQVVQEHIRTVLVACNGNKLKAAEVLGISRSTLYRMLDAAEPGSLLLAG
jgi:DNA-binding NtrC family response regulator